MNEKLVITDGEIDLREDDKQLLETYNIYLHKTDEKVGKIVYRDYHYSEALGDIGYEIKEEYRGTNYAVKAIKLLSDILFNNGITDFWIVSKKDNISSIRTIEKYGAKKQYTTKDGTMLYICDTRPMAKESNSTNEILK